MDKKGSDCGGKKTGLTCRECSDVTLQYWCETCQRAVEEKRCPGCGLKCRKVCRPGGGVP